MSTSPRVNPDINNQNVSLMNGNFVARDLLDQNHRDAIETRDCQNKIYRCTKIGDFETGGHRKIW